MVTLKEWLKSQGLPEDTQITAELLRNIGGDISTPIGATDPITLPTDVEDYELPPELADIDTDGTLPTLTPILSPEQWLETFGKAQPWLRTLTPTQRQQQYQAYVAEQQKSQPVPDTITEPTTTEPFDYIPPPMPPRPPEPGTDDLLPPPPPPPWEPTEEEQEPFIPYMDIVPEGAEAFKPQETSWEKYLKGIIGERAGGKGIAEVTPELVEKYRPIVEQAMAPKYQQAIKAEQERWSAAGRSFDTSKIASIGRLTIEHGAEVAGKTLGLAVDEVNRMNAEIGAALGRGMELSKMEQAEQFLSADQAFQLNMYKRKIRDEAIQGTRDLKIKDYYIRLARAWDTQDWQNYRQLATELAKLGQPTTADYLISLIPSVIGLF